MTRYWFFAPFAGLTIVAGYLGLQLGQPVTEADIINHYASTYLAQAPDGALATDCAAKPHPDPAVRMVISCVHPSGVTTTYFVGPRGEALPEPTGPSA